MKRDSINDNVCVIYAECHMQALYAACHYAECCYAVAPSQLPIMAAQHLRVLFVIMPNAVILHVIILNAFIVHVILLFSAIISITELTIFTRSVIMVTVARLSVVIQRMFAPNVIMLSVCCGAILTFCTNSLKSSQDG